MGFVLGFRHLCVYLRGSCLNSLKLNGDMVNTVRAAWRVIQLTSYSKVN